MDRGCIVDAFRLRGRAADAAHALFVERVHCLRELRHFLSDWALACCFQLAYQQRWRINPDHAIAGIRHPTGFVREAAIVYIHAASPRTFHDLYPSLRRDPNPLVSALAEKLRLMRTPAHSPVKTRPAC